MQKNIFALAITCTLSFSCAVDPFIDQRALSDTSIGALGNSALSGAAGLLLGGSPESAVSGDGRAVNRHVVIEIINV